MFGVGPMVQSGGTTAGIAEVQDRLETHLDVVLAAFRVSGDEGSPAATEAGQAATAAAADALRLGYDPQRMQIELDWWSRASGGQAFRIEPWAAM